AAAFKPGSALLYAASTTPSRLFPGSSAVEQPAVNRLVAGSNPARGAKLNQRVSLKYFNQEIDQKSLRDNICDNILQISAGLIFQWHRRFHKGSASRMSISIAESRLATVGACGFE